MASNLQVLLASRPTGKLQRDHFRIVETEAPEPGPGELLLENLWLSIDPYMRGRMRENRFGYADSYPLDAPVGGGTVSRVVASHNADFAVGDLVVAEGGWQRYAVATGAGLAKLPSDMRQPSMALGVLGMTGFTAWHGLLKIGAPQPGETVVVAAASGAVGSVVGQLAKAKGCRAVGIAGGPEKCRYVVEDLGFDACIDHVAPDLPARLADAVPGGVDVYFENIGGAVFDAVWPLMNVGARVPVCGAISYYETPPAAVADRLPAVTVMLITRRIRMEGFMIGDHFADGFDPFQREMTALLQAGQVRTREDVVDGLERAPEMLIRVLSGGNFGKALVKI